MTQPNGATQESNNDEQRIEAAQLRIRAALHGVQTGVDYMIQYRPNGAHTPKHLRTGIDSAMVEHAALVKLLIDKGVISEVEYFESQAEFMERERAMYEQELTKITGIKVNLA